MIRLFRLLLGCVIVAGVQNAVSAELSAWENALVAKYREGCARKDTAMQSLPADYNAAARADEIYLREKERLHGGEILSRSVLLEDSVVNVRVLESQTDAGAKIRLATWQAAWAEGPLFAEYARLPALPNADFHAVTNLIRQVLLPARGWIVKGLDRRIDSSFVVRGKFSGRVFDNPYAEEAWFFMIDDRPFANWSHPSRFVFVAKDLSSCVVLYADEPEAICRGTERVRLPELMRLVDSGRGSASISRIKSFLNNAFTPANALSYGGDASHSYAVIISGGSDIEQNYSRYWGDVAMIYSTLRKKYAMPKENIRVCVSDGKSNEDDMRVSRGDGGWGDVGYYNSPHDLDGDGIDDVGYDSKKSTIQSVFSSLAGSLTSEDRLFVFITDHGTQNKSNGTCYLVPWITDSYSTESQYYALMISASEFASMVQGIKCPISFAFEFCYSGGFIQPLVAQQNRVVATACGVEVSNAFLWCDPRDEDHGETLFCSAFDCCNPWAWAFNSAIRGCDSTWSEPWSDDSSSQVGNADSDGDGLVSMYEAGVLAKNWVLNTTQRSSRTGTTLTFCDTPGYGESVENLGKALFVLKQSKSLPISVPKIPSAPTVSLSGTRLSWSAVSGANYYKVYRSTNPYAEPTALSGWQTACSYTCSAPSSYGSYFYFVKASSTGEDATASEFSTQDAHLSYGSYAEVHKYGTSSFNVSPVSSDSTPLFNMTFYKLSGSSTAISGSFNGTTIGSGYPTVGSSGASQLIIARNTFTVSGSSNASPTPRFWGFYTTFENPPAGSWSSTGGKSYAEVVWLAHPHYYYQSGVASFSTGATSQSAGKDGGAYSVSVTATPSTTSWSASTSADWITLYRTSSSGSGTLGYAVAANDTSSQRTGTITINGASTTKTLTVTQAAGVATPTLSSLAISGASNVTSGEQTPYTCKANYSDGSSKTVSPSWSIYSGSSYASIDSSSGVLTAYMVSSPQSVTIRAAYGGISQDKSVTVNPKPSAPGKPSVSVSTYGTGSANASYIMVSWSGGSGATSFDLYRSTSSTRPSSPFATNVTSPYYDYKSSSGLTPGVMYYYWVAAVNSAGTTYSDSDWGNILVSLSLGKSSDSYAAVGGDGSASVTANTSWSASSDVSWIMFGTKAGNGNGTLTYTVAANASTASRQGTITVTAGSGTSYPATQTIAVTQEEKSDFVISDGVLTTYTGPGGAVTIPDGVTSIGGLAFANCSTLTSVTLPSSLTSIGIGAFSSCGLTSVTIPSGVTSIDWGAFEYCHRLKTIAVAPDNAAYASADGILYSRDMSELVCCPGGRTGSLTVPSGVATVGSMAFGGCGELTSVTMSSGVTAIEYEGFYGCAGLVSVTIPSSVTSIGTDAFAYCSALEEVYVDYGDAGRVKGLLSSSGLDVSGIRFIEKASPDFEISDGVLIKYKGAGGAVTIPDGVTRIGDGAFYNCAEMTSLNVPDSVTGIGAIAFAFCKKLSSIDLPVGLKSIGEQTFFGCSSLKSVHIPADVVDFGIGVFENCYDLESITVDSANGCLAIINGLLCSKDGTQVLSCPGRAQSVQLGSTVERICNGAFFGCTNLVSVGFAEGLEEIGQEAFVCCSGLLHIDLPAGTKWVKYRAFSQCVSLASIYVPSSVASIGESAFSGCAALAEVCVDRGDADRVKGLLLASGLDVSNVCFVEKGAMPDVETGTWIYDYSFAKAFADANDLPLVIFWTNPGCSICEKMIAAFEMQKFQDWQQSRDYVFVYSEGDATVRELARNDSGEFPFVAVQWPSKGIDVRFSGRDGAMPVKDGDLVDQFTQSVDASLLPAPDLPTYGPWGEAEAVKNPDKLGPTFLTDMAVEIDGEPAEYGDVVAVFRGDTGALCGLGKVMDDSGTLTVVCYAPKGVTLSFKVWLSESGVEEAVVVKCDNASKLVAPESGAFYDGHAISCSTVNECIVSFNANGGAGVMEPLRCEAGRVYKLPKCGFKMPAGKTRFAGWAGPNDKRYDDEMLIFNLAKPGETVKMTAIWE